LSEQVHELEEFMVGLTRVERCFHAWEKLRLVKVDCGGQ
jgi:hypothetical protein